MMNDHEYWCRVYDNRKEVRFVKFKDYMSLGGQQIDSFAGSPENFLILANNFLRINVPQSIKDKFLSPEFSTLFSQYIYPQHYDDCINTVDVREFDDVKVFSRFVNMFIVKFMRTYEKYFKLLSLYKSEENKLLDSIKTTSKTGSRINEIPQILKPNAYDENYTNQSTIVDSETSTEGNTKIARLKEIHNLYDNINEEWLNEFSDLFTPLVED